jgi:hypothetical protein
MYEVRLSRGARLALMMMKGEFVRFLDQSKIIGGTILLDLPQEMAEARYGENVGRDCLAESRHDRLYEKERRSFGIEIDALKSSYSPRHRSRAITMRILISGASGLIGGALRPTLVAAEHSTSVLVRRPPAAGEVQWDPATQLDSRSLEGFDAIIHLAGKNIAGRWSEKFKREVRESRVQGTRTLATAAAEAFRQTGAPRIFVAASAIGYYGNRGDEELTEASSPGNGFLAEVCEEWEEAANPAAAAGIRVVHPRIGVVLARHGGALPAMLPAFRIGLGGPVGDGGQFWSWITLDDVVGAFLFALTNDSVSGALNAVAPNSVRNAEFVRALGHALHRPSVFPLPAFVVKALFGEMGESLLLASARVAPAKLEAAGYRFRHPDLDEALRAVLSSA